jgi:hypothetical protein
MGDPQGYGTHGTGAYWWGRSLPAETTGEYTEAYQACFPTNDYICKIQGLPSVFLKREKPVDTGVPN